MINIKEVEKALNNRVAKNWHKTLFTEFKEYPCFSGYNKWKKNNNCSNNGNIFLITEHVNKHFGLFCDNCIEFWLEENPRISAIKLDEEDIIKIRFLIQVS